MNDANSVWDFMLLTLWFFLLVCWIMVLFSVIGDLFRDKDSGGFTKFLWIVFIIVLPFLGVLVYVIVRGRGMTERTLKAQAAAKSDFDSYVQEVAGSGGDPASQIANAKKLLDSGAITQAEFDQLKAKALV